MTTLLNARGRNVLGGTLITRGLNRLGLLRSHLRGSAGFDVSAETIGGRLDGIRAVLTEELIHILRKDVRVRDHDVIRRIVFGSSLNNGCMLVDLCAQLLDGINGLGELFGVLSLEFGDVVGLLDQRILKDAAVAVEQSGSFLSEVLENLQALKTCRVEIPVDDLLSRSLTLSQSRLLLLCWGISRRYLGQGDRLRRTECRCCLVVPRHH